MREETRRSNKSGVNDRKKEIIAGNKTYEKSHSCRCFSSQSFILDAHLIEHAQKHSDRTKRKKMSRGLTKKKKNTHKREKEELNVYLVSLMITR